MHFWRNLCGAIAQQLANFQTSQGVKLGRVKSDNSQVKKFLDLLFSCQTRIAAVLRRIALQN